MRRLPAPRRPRFSPRRIVRLLLKVDTEVSDNERTLRVRVEQQDSGLARTADLGRRFREMVKERKQDVWENWLDERKRRQHHRRCAPLPRDCRKTRMQCAQP